MKDISIALVNWNTKDLLQQCLDSVYRTAGDLRLEVIVVDNASEDGSPDIVAERYPDVVLVRSQVNMGFAAGVNIAFRHSTAPYFLLLNTDTIVLEGALQGLLWFMETHAEAGVAGCRLLNCDGTLQRSCSRFPSPMTELFDALYLSKLFPRSKLFGCYSMSWWDFEDVREVDFAGGSALMVRRQAIQEVGLMDEGYFMYAEEADWCYRMWKHGWGVYYFPGAQVIHLGGRSAAKFGSDVLLHLYISRYRFVRKHYGRVSAASMRAVIGLSSALRWSAYSAAAAFARGIGRLRGNSAPSPAADLLADRIGFHRKLLGWVLCDRVECQPRSPVSIP